MTLDVNTFNMILSSVAMVLGTVLLFLEEPAWAAAMVSLATYSLVVGAVE